MNELSRKSLQVSDSFSFNKNKNYSILLVGKVQSGKTNNFLSIIARRFDAECNLCIVLAGTVTTIFEQNAERIKKVFLGDA